MLSSPFSSRAPRFSADAEAGYYARREARAIHRRVLREEWHLWLIVVAGMGLFAVPAVLLQPSSFARGAVAGAMVTLTIGSIAFFVVLRGGTAPLLMAEVAEQWTAQSLRVLEAHGWHLANHVLLSGGDADHVLVGPDGVIVVETKWRRDAWRERDFDRDAAVDQARRTASSVRLLLGREVPTEAVVVLWTSSGTTRPDPTIERRYDDVVVIPGDQLKPWALRRGRSRLSEDEVEEIWKRLVGHKSANVVFERQHRPVPTSFNTIVLAAIGLLLLAILGFLVSAQLLSWTSSLTAWLGLSAAVGAIGSIALHRGLWPPPIQAFLLGWAGSLLLAVGLAVRHVVT